MAHLPGTVLQRGHDRNMRNPILRSSLITILCLPIAAYASDLRISGYVVDLQGNPVSGAGVQIVQRSSKKRELTITNRDGQFEARIDATGEYDLRIVYAGFRSFTQSVKPLSEEENQKIQLIPLPTRSESITVTADVNDVDLVSPDPAEKIFVSQDLLDANPGRPGAPVSIPGYPIETASSGIKAPQYFAPGVAGDHGEPIAQFLLVGSYLVPNNLSANAHGNGYADPNIFIPEVLESVQIDGGAFNVRQGNHAVNLAATYGLRSHLEPFITLTGDSRDIDVVAALSPTQESWIAFEGSYGNGFLDRLEHRQQYKGNGQRMFRVARHQLTLLGIAYYGFSYVPGLVPIYPPNGDDANVPKVGDTIDPRQRDQTHTALLALNDVWHFSSNQQLQLGAFLRTYNLALFSNFGQGLIRQSEFRTVAGETINYVNTFSEAFSLLAGLDYEREAPRRDNLDHYNFYTPGDMSYGPFTKVDSNNVTLTSITPYIAGAGALTRFFRYYAGWRRDQIDIDNRDLLHSENSFQKWAGVNSPKATLSFIPGESWFVPLLSFSYGQAFFTEDPRIGTGTMQGTPVAIAHSYQFVANKTIRKTGLKLTLGHVATSQQLAKIDPDTGLQEDQGPGRLRFLTLAVRQTFQRGSFLATFSKADARNVLSGEPTPEAPRTIVDLLGSADKLPFRLQARGEFEYVGEKPLGTGCRPNLNAQCVGVPMREFRAAVVHPFLNGRLTLGVNMLIASGYAGQTTENFYPSDVSEIVGVRIPSYAGVNITYHFGNPAAN